MEILQYLLIYLPILSSSLSEVYGKCYEFVDVGYTTVTVTPPGYPTRYETDLNCTWVVFPRNIEDSMLIRVTDITVNCAGDTLNVYSEITGRNIHQNECTSGTSVRTLQYQVIALGGVHAVMTSDASSSASEKGFKMYMISGKDFSRSGCSGSAQTLTATSSEQFLSSPSFPSTYPLNQSCTWTITTSNSSANVHITFRFLDIERTCNYDYLEINESATSIAKLCTEDSFEPTNNSYTSTGTSFKLTFTTDNYESSKHGFLLSYKEIDAQTATVDSSNLWTWIFYTSIPVILVGFTLAAFISYQCKLWTCGCYSVKLKRTKAQVDRLNSFNRSVNWN